jgi:EAL domain-containing protein (putative c-di-GMP-specific phosphodiesterase class I)
VAEEIGLITGIGEWAIATACQTASTWPDGIKVAVNLSAAQFGRCDLVAIASNALLKSGLEAKRLEMEVTESVLLDDDAGMLDVLHGLKALGIQIALDDFGTGYSSLSYLRNFPFDKIKIDQSFVRDLPQRKDCVAIVGAVAQLAASLNMSTVAEGVETVDHLEKVRAAGCTEVQGYLISRPVPDGDVVRVIEDCNQRLSLANFPIGAAA